jgi:hypothetical protein
MTKAATRRKSKPIPRPRAKAASTREAKPVKAETKRDQVLALLRRPGGVSISAMAKATGWQKHSVRGFLAGTVRGKLGLNVESEKRDGQRTYRIPAAKPSKAKAGAVTAAGRAKAA